MQHIPFLEGHLLLSLLSVVLTHKRGSFSILLTHKPCLHVAVNKEGFVRGHNCDNSYETVAPSFSKGGQHSPVVNSIWFGCTYVMGSVSGLSTSRALCNP